MGGLTGGSGAKSGGGSAPLAAIGPGEASGLMRNMYADAGLGGLGRGGNTGITQPMTGSPTPMAAFDIGSAGANAAQAQANINAPFNMLTNQANQQLAQEIGAASTTGSNQPASSGITSSATPT